LLAQVLELAIKRGLPVQIRASGDQQATLADVNSSISNPLAFQPVLRAQRYADLKVVFLNSYPFVREAAYLASVYPGVFFDLSLANSLLAPDLTSLYYEALSAAPYSKLLAGTGGNSQPESFWYGAVCLRRGLSEALKELTEKGYLLKAQMEEVERAVLRSNAINLYDLH
jgi:predicted TIM-barrel fold metal-dependent hydrolase